MWQIAEKTKKRAPWYRCRVVYMDRLLDKGDIEKIFAWPEIKEDLKSLPEIERKDNGKTLTLRNECEGVCGKVFQSVGVVMSPTIRER